MSRLVTIRYNLDKWLETQLSRGSDLSCQNLPSKMITLNYRKERLSTPTPFLSPVPWVSKKREERVRRPKHDENEPFLVRPVGESLERLRNYKLQTDSENTKVADQCWYVDLTNVAQRLRLLRDTYKVLQAVRKKRAMGERVDFRTAHELKSKTGLPDPLDDDLRKNNEEEKPPPPPPARRGRPRKRGGAGRGRKPGPRLRTAIPAPAEPTATRGRGRRRAADKAPEGKETPAPLEPSSTPAPSENLNFDDSALTAVGPASLSQPLPGNEIMVPELMPRLAAKARETRPDQSSSQEQAPHGEELMAGLGQELGQRLTQELGQLEKSEDFTDHGGAPMGQWQAPQWQNPAMGMAANVAPGANLNMGVGMEEYLAQGYADPNSLSELTVSIIENLKRRNPSGLVLASLYNRPGGLNFLPQWTGPGVYSGESQEATDSQWSEQHGQSGHPGQFEQQ